MSRRRRNRSGPEAEVAAPLPAKVGRVVSLVHVARGTLRIGDLALEVIALSDIREVQAQAGADHPTHSSPG